MERSARIFVAGHLGLLGSALVRRLSAEGYDNLILRSHDELNLTDQSGVERMFNRERPEYVFLAAARVGGIQANVAKPAEFIRENLLIQTSVIHAASVFGTRRLLFFGSTCLYPKVCPQPMREEFILSGPMEPTSEAYSTAKLAGLVMCDAYSRQHGAEFLTVIPSTLYGPHDNFDPDGGHVLSSLVRRFHEARNSDLMAVWGSGKPIREFLYSDDLAEACLLLMNLKTPLPKSPINVGSGEGVSIGQLAAAIGSAVSFNGKISFDLTKPDGAPAKVLDSTRMRDLGWSPRTRLGEGIRKVYEWYQTQN